MGTCQFFLSYQTHFPILLGGWLDIELSMYSFQRAGDVACSWFDVFPHTIEGETNRVVTIGKQDNPIWWWLEHGYYDFPYP
jgi:hypothetical protein